MKHNDTDHIVETYRDRIIETTQELVRRPSIIDVPEEGMPFGRQIADVLNYTLALCESMGFRVKNCDNYCGWAEIGTGEEMIGILCHLDIVPIGEGWTYEPLAAEIIDGKLYGRGSIDDKGPTVAALYAVRAYVDLHPDLNKRIRLIFGCNEENDWICMDHYNETEELPTCGFVPDAQFPVIYAEKGISFPILDKDFQVKGATYVKSLNGGSSANMVAGSCSATLVCDNADEVAKTMSELSAGELNGAKLSVKTEGNNVVLETTGRIAHGSTPWEGINAISSMMKVIGTVNDLDPEQKKFVDYYNNCIGYELDGVSLCGCVVEDEASGRLVNNAGTCTMDETHGSICLNERYPVTVKGSDLHELIRKQAEQYGIDLSIRLDSPPGYVPKDHPMITKLMNVYRSYVDDPTEPMLIGGGTYARSVKNCVAFGPLLPGRVELAHCPDEYIYIDDLILSAKIYAAAIAELCSN